MASNKLERIWKHAIATRQAASDAESPPPFKSKEVQEASQLYRLQRLAQNEISRAASEILKEHGFRADGLKRKGRK